MEHALDHLPEIRTPRGKVPFSKKKLAAFIQRWQVHELAVFGSVLRQDFRPDSDIDLLVTFAANSRWGLFELVTMNEELVEIFGRPVDLVEKDALRNPYRRNHILQNMQVLYAA